MLRSLTAMFAVYTVLSVAGMVLVKRAVPALRAAMAAGASPFGPGMMVAIGAGMYIVAFGIWMLILARTPLTLAYPIAVGLTMAFSTVAAIVILGEPLKWESLVGMALVFAGVVMLAR